MPREVQQGSSDLKSSRLFRPSCEHGAALTASLFFFVALLPTMGAVGYTWVTAADKHVYLASAGFVLLLAWLLSGLWAAASGSGRSIAARAGVLGVVVLLATAEGHLERVGAAAEVRAARQESERMDRAWRS